MSDWASERVGKLLKGSDGRPVAFRDLDSEDFPFLIQGHDEDTGDLVWAQTVHGPGALEVPGFAPRKVTITMTMLRTRRTVVTTSDGVSTEMESAAPQVPCVDCGQLTACTRPLEEYEIHRGVAVCRDAHRCSACS